VYLLSAPLSEPDSQPSRSVLESRGRELADLFRALASLVDSDSVASHLTNPREFRALLEAEQVLTTYFNVPRVGLCILDTDFRYLSINKTLAEMNGKALAEHLGKTVREMLGDFAEVVEPQFNRVVTTGRPVLDLDINFMLPN